MKSRKPFYQKGTFSDQTNAENCCRAADEARVRIVCVILVGTGKVLLREARSIGWDMDLTRPKWQKNRKKMAGKMGKKSGRVR